MARKALLTGAASVALAAALGALFQGTAAYAQDAGLAPTLALCGACHGAQGVSAMANTPSLAAQPRTFIETQLILIREGLRPLPAMQGMLDKINDAQIVALAKHFAALPAPKAIEVSDKAAVERGQALSKQALCDSCHLPTQAGRDQIPRLAGQREDYLVSVMAAFRDGKTTGRDTQMQNVMRGFTDAQIKDLAKYFVQLP